MTWTIEGQEPWYVEHPTSPSVTSVGIAKDGVIKAVAVSTTLEDEGDYIVAALNAYEAESPRHLLVGTADLNEVYVIPRDLTDEEWVEIKYNVDRKADPDIPLWRIQEVIRYANFIAGSRGLDIVRAALSAEVEG